MESEYKTMLLNRIEMEVDLVAEELLMRPEVKIREVMGMISVHLRGVLAGEEPKAEVISYPLDWFEAFKDRWFPEWLLRRYPVKRVVYRIDANRYYPDFKVELPEGRNVDRVRIWKGTECCPQSPRNKP